MDDTNYKVAKKITTKTDKDDIDYDKVLNSICSCGIGLPWVKDEIVMIYPCEHMFHEGCYKKIKDGLCPICKSVIEKTMALFDEDLHHQRFSDILSVSCYVDMCYTTPGRFLDSLFDLATIFARVPFTTNKEEGREICEKIFSLNNLTLKVYGLEKTRIEKNKVYICNHVAHLELVIIYYLLGTGFLASSIVGQSKIVDQAKQIVPLLTFDRGNKSKKINIVDEMRNFVDEKGSICLFPEGMMKHPDTLIRFRTGAFHIGRPIYAVTIRHNDIISDAYINGFLYKLSGKRDINMEVHIMGPYYPPFDDNAIEKIRVDMARSGNMVLSRVSNRDIVDRNDKKQIL
jgi:1-acyl-sn-glycerol-3-phosphate acyltransferase